MNIKVDDEFHALIPPLAEAERALLEASIKADGCRDPLVLWLGKSILLDGHNRYEICTALDRPFKTTGLEFDSRDAARNWMILNQLGRRNLTDLQRIRLARKLEGYFREQAREREVEGGRQKGRQKSADPPIRSRTEIAKAASTSHDTYTKGAYLLDKADDQAIAAVEAGKSTINREYTRLKREEIKEENARLKATKPPTPKGKYDVIVIDPPWPMQKIERDCAPNQAAFDYPTMTEAELEALYVPSAEDCHLFVWTTQKFLPMTLRLLPAWGARYVCAFVWHKPGGFQPFGLPQYNCEFAIYAKIGTPAFTDTKAFPVCFSAARGEHSEKPEEFYEMIARTTKGARLDMFSRRAIKGFDSWGNEA